MKSPILLLALLALMLVLPTGFATDLKDRVVDAVAYRVDSPPVIDGKLDDEAWMQVAGLPGAVLGGWRTMASGQIPAKIAPQQRLVYLGWDSAALYIGLQAYVADPGDLRVDGNGNVFLGDCLEVHLKIPGGEYFQFGVDFEGNFAPGPIPQGVDATLVKTQTELEDNYWTAEMAIPWEVLGVTPEAGARFGVAFSANHATQGDEPPDSLTRIHWGRAFSAKQFENILELR